MMATIEKALQIAARAHEGQTDKDGQPYILHPLRVMNSVEGEEARIVAVLDDVIEDSEITEDDLWREGFGEPVLAVLACLTHRKGESQAEYVVRCKGNEVARRVKLADRETTPGRYGRCCGPTGWSPRWSGSAYTSWPTSS